MARCRVRLSLYLPWALILLSVCSIGISGIAAAQSAAPATPTFLVSPVVSLAGAPASVAVGDLNGDNVPDLVITNVSAGKISVLLGKGEGQFGPAVDYTVGKQPSFVVIGDVNGDGKPDVVVGNEADGTVSVLLGNGDGTLANAVTYPAVANPVFVGIGDLNGDGKPDLLISGKASNTVAVLLNDGTGHFSASIPYNIGKGSQSLAIADFDGDGHLDVASANADGTVTVLFGRGDGGFRNISSVNVASAPLSSIAAGDFNGDGKVDLALTQSGARILTVLLGRGDGTFLPGSNLDVGSNPAFVIAADVNGDNIVDLVTANQSGNTFSVLVGNGDGTFKPSLDFTAGNSPRGLAAADFNGDGHLDLAIVNFGDHTLSLPLGNGDGTFKAARAYNVDLDRKSVAAGDLDGDGKPDLVVTNFCGADATCSSNGTLSVLLDVGDATYKLAGSYPLGAGPLSVVLADVNGDKKLDVIAVNRGDKTVSVLLGNGDGSFQSALTYPAGTSPTALVAGDFDRDGKLDLAIAGDCGSSNCIQPGEISLLFGNGDGTFRSAATYPAGYSPSSLVVGDLTGSGNPDLIVANACGEDGMCHGNGTASVLLGDGKGGFKPGVEVQLGLKPLSLALGDLNGDGKLDLVATYGGGNKVGVLLGNGDATFKSAVTYPVGVSPSAVVMADFNGDGKQDVAVASLKDSKVSVLFGNGDGTLQSAIQYPVGLGPESLAAISQNKSGHSDLVSANGNSGLNPKGSNVTVLLNLSTDGSMPSTTTVTSSPNPSYVNQQVTLTATVTGSDGTPTGTVTFTYNNGTVIPECPNPVMLNNSGVATCATSSLPGGSDIVKASYSGDSTYGMSSGTVTQVVNKINSNTALTSSPNPSNVNQAVVLTATVTPSSPGGLSPTGTVTFTYNNGTVIPECPNPVMLNHSGVATCSTQSLPAPSDMVKASYNGDGNFNTSNSTVTQTINKINSVTALMSSPNPSTVNVPVLLTATVTPSSPGGLSPTGTVTFTYNNGRVIPECPNPVMLNHSGVATCTTSSLPAGSDTVLASYNGDGNFNSSSSMVTQTVVSGNSHTVLMSSLNPSNVNRAVTLTATVTASTAGDLSPSGTVTFTYNNGTVIPDCMNPATLNNGSATCMTKSLPVGSDTVLASYSGDSNFHPSSGTLTQTVHQTATTTVNVSSLNPSVSTQTVTFTATVQDKYSGPFSPTGTVTFTDTTGPGSPVQICTATLTTMETASCASSMLLSGPRTITATYSGDNSFVGSPGSLTQTVQNFSLTPSPTIPISIAPGYSNSPAGSLFTNPALNQTVTATATPLYGFTDSVALSCSISPPVNNPLTCRLSPTTLASGPTMVTVTAGTPSQPTPPGLYTLTVTGTDSRVRTLTQTATFVVNVIQTATPVSVLAGDSGNSSPTFAGQSGVTVTFFPSMGSTPTPSCPLVTGPGVPPGGVLPTNIGINCTAFNPTSRTFDSNGSASVTVTISTTPPTQTSQLRNRTGVLAAFWLGIPGVVLIGSVRGRRLTSRVILQSLAILLIIVALLSGVGCGGGFNRTTTTAGTGTPTGSYQVLVQGTDANGMTYSAIVPVNVGHQ